jgi:hypothetical protein
MVIQSVKPWMSENEIDKGARWFAEIGQALSVMRVGIICLTPENLEASWLLWEAGALAKSIDDRTRLCTYLLGGLQAHEVKPPLGLFQGTKSEKEDTRKLIHTMNRAVATEDPLPKQTLDAVFEKMWPELETALITMPVVRQETPKRSVEDMVVEILSWVRSESDRRMEMQVPLQPENDDRMIYRTNRAGRSSIWDTIGLRSTQELRRFEEQRLKALEPLKDIKIFTIREKGKDGFSKVTGFDAKEKPDGTLTITDHTGRSLAIFKNVEAWKEFYANSEFHPGEQTDKD